MDMHHRLLPPPPAVYLTVFFPTNFFLHATFSPSERARARGIEEEEKKPPNKSSLGLDVFAVGRLTFESRPPAAYLADADAILFFYNQFFP